MNGMEMMLKALGIDPEEIKRSMLDTIGKLQAGIQSLDTSLKAILERQDIIAARLERLEKHLGVSEEVKTEDENQFRRISRQ